MVICTQESVSFQADLPYRRYGVRQEQKQAVTLIFSVLVVAVPTYGLTRKGMNQVGKGRLVKYCMSRKYDNGSCDAIAKGRVSLLCDILHPAIP